MVEEWFSSRTRSSKAFRVSGSKNSLYNVNNLAPQKQQGLNWPATVSALRLMHVCVHMTKVLLEWPSSVCFFAKVTNSCVSIAVKTYTFFFYAHAVLQECVLIWCPALESINPPEEPLPVTDPLAVITTEGTFWSFFLRHCSLNINNLSHGNSY